MMKAIVAVVFALTLGACATAARYEAVLNSWIGETESSLVSSWGPPVNVYVAPDGTRILTYNDTGNLTLPGTPPSYRSTVVGNTVYSQPYGGTAPMDIALACTTNFTIVNGRITTWRYEGNNCVSL